MRTVVTGGAGFLGSHLVDRLLAEDHEVHVVDDLSTGALSNLADARRVGMGRFSFQQLNVKDPALTGLFERIRPDVVYHLAGPASVPASVADPVTDAAGTVVASLVVMEACRTASVAKIVYASSAAVYGEPDAVPTPESHPRRPLSPHGAAKDAVAAYLAAYRELHGLEFTALAMANVYGPRQDPPAVVAAFAAAVKSGEPVAVHGTGRQTRDLLFVDDAVDALARASERGSGLVLNVGAGTEVSVNGLHAALCRVAGVEPLVAHLPARPGDLERVCLDPARAAIHLGWRPWTDLETGLSAVLNATL